MDFLASFMEYTKGAPTADLYRLWSGISCIAGALERRVWTVILHEPIYPNVFCLLVGGPGAGKTPAIGPVRRLWRSNPKLNIAADSMSKAGFFDALESGARRIPMGGQFVEYSALAVAADEFGMFMSSYDLDFVSAITGVYDGRDGIGEQRRHALGAGKKRADVVNPICTILAGSQPGFMSTLFPDEVWAMGFTARIIMVYSGEQQIPNLTFGRNGQTDERKDLWKHLVKEVARFGNTFGEYTWEPSAEKALADWVKADCYPKPEHSQLVHYNPKRGVHVSKLAMISAVSRGDSRVITLNDLQRAWKWLFNAEMHMPNIFRDMKGKSDNKVLQEVFMFMWSEWSKDKQPLHESKLLHFIADRTPTTNVQRILDLVEKTGMASRGAGTTLYTPRPRHLHGME